jgi:hypothetical protein
VPSADHDLRHPARAAAAACRAHIDPRPRDHSRRHRRRLAFDAQPAMLAEHVRARLARQLCAQHTSRNGYLPIIALTAKWEQAFAESIVGQGDDRSLAMQPSRLYRVHQRGARKIRAGGARRRGAGAGDLGIIERFRAQTIRKFIPVRAHFAWSSASGRKPACCRNRKSIPRLAAPGKTVGRSMTPSRRAISAAMSGETPCGSPEAVLPVTSRKLLILMPARRTPVGASSATIWLTIDPPILASRALFALDRTA